MDTETTSKIQQGRLLQVDVQNPLPARLGQRNGRVFHVPLHSPVLEAVRCIAKQNRLFVAGDKQGLMLAHRADTVSIHEIFFAAGALVENGADFPPAAHLLSAVGALNIQAAIEQLRDHPALQDGPGGVMAIIGVELADGLQHNRQAHPVLPDGCRDHGEIGHGGMAPLVTEDIDALVLLAGNIPHQLLKQLGIDQVQDHAVQAGFSGRDDEEQGGFLTPELAKVDAVIGEEPGQGGIVEEVQGRRGDGLKGAHHLLITRDQLHVLVPGGFARILIQEFLKILGPSHVLE